MPLTDHRQLTTDHWFLLRSPQPRAHLHSLYTGSSRFALAGSRRAGAKSNYTLSKGLKKKVEVDQDSCRSLSALRRDRMEDASRQPRRTQRCKYWCEYEYEDEYEYEYEQRPAGHPLRLPA